MADSTSRILQQTREQGEHYVGEAGEITVDTTQWTLKIHDGHTPGGFTLSTQQLLNSSLTYNAMLSEGVSSILTSDAVAFFVESNELEQRVDEHFNVQGLETTIQSIQDGLTTLSETQVSEDVLELQIAALETSVARLEEFLIETFNRDQERDDEEVPPESGDEDDSEDSPWGTLQPHYCVQTLGPVILPKTLGFDHNHQVLLNEHYVFLLKSNKTLAYWPKTRDYHAPSLEHKTLNNLIEIAGHGADFMYRDDENACFRFNLNRQRFGFNTLQELPNEAAFNVKKIAICDDFSAVIKPDDSVFYWATFDPVDDYHLLLNIPDSARTNIKDVKKGRNFVVALKNTGEIIVWGRDPATANVNIVEDIPTAATTDIVKIAAGYDHIAVLKTSGEIIEWGRFNGVRTSPVGVFTDVAAGSFFTMGLSDQGVVYGWGDHSAGETLDYYGENALYTQRGFKTRYGTTRAILAYGNGSAIIGDRLWD